MKAAIGKFGICNMLILSTTVWHSSALAGSLFDGIAIIDRSGSMVNEIQFVGDSVLDLSTSLEGEGFSTTFGLVSYGGGLSVSEASPFVYTFDSELFTSASNVQTAANGITASGGTICSSSACFDVEDGYDAIHAAVSAYSSEFRSGTSRNIVLVTDTSRQIVNSALSRSSIEGELLSNNIVLNVVVSAEFLSTDGSKLLAIYKNADGVTVGINESGDVETFGSISFSAGSVESDYIALALATGGVVADISGIDEGNAASTALINALTQSITDVVDGSGSSSSTATVQSETISESTETQAAASIRTVVAAISNRVRAYQRNPTGQIGQPTLQQLGFGTMTGVAGGDSFSGLNFWTDVTASRLDSTNVNGAFDGYSQNLLFGADKLLANGQFVVGAAGGLENVNLGLKGLGGERDSYGGSISFYAGYLINETWSLDGQLGAGRYNNAITTNRANGTSSSGSFHSNRLQGALNLSFNKQIDKISLYGAGGYSWIQERASNYQTNDNVAVSPGHTTLGQLRVTGEAAYQWRETVQPYITATYEIDTVTTTSGDMSGMIIGGGLRAPLNEALTLGASATGQVLRHDEEAYTLNVNLRYTF